MTLGASSAPQGIDASTISGNGDAAAEAMAQIQSWGSWLGDNLPTIAGAAGYGAGSYLGGGVDPSLLMAHVTRGSGSTADDSVLDPTEISDAYKSIWGKDPLYLAYINSGHSLTTAGELGDHDYSQYTVDYPPDSNGDGQPRYRIVVEDDLDSAVLGAVYFRLEMLRVLAESGGPNEMQDKFFFFATRAGQSEPDTQAFINKSRLTELKNKMASIKATAEVILSIVNDGADITITVNELSAGNYLAALGFLPIVSSTMFKGGRVLIKGGDETIDATLDIQRGLDKLAEEGVESAYDLAHNARKKLAEQYADVVKLKRPWSWAE